MGTPIESRERPPGAASTDAGGRPRATNANVTEVRCKSALNRVKGMFFHWSLNPYRGCSHHCAYCYARTTHAFLGLDVGEDFATQLFVKTNVADVLRTELAKRTWKRETVAIGTSTDPYQPLEGRYRLTRACLSAFADFASPANVTTKGTLIVRDVDVLQTLHRRAGAGVSMSLITLDEDIWRKLEPGTAPPSQRLRALRQLTDAGIPCGIALAPVLPKLTDSSAALEAVVRAAAENGAHFLWAGAIHMEPSVRDFFLTQLNRHFPHATAPYERVFGSAGGPAPNRYAPKAYASRLQLQVAELKDRYGLGDRRLGGPGQGANLPTAEVGVHETARNTDDQAASRLAPERRLGDFPAAQHALQLGLPLE